MNTSHFSQFAPVRGGRSHVFADQSDATQLMVCVTTGVASVNVHLTPSEATAFANSILEGVEWMAALAAQRESAQRQAEQDRIPAGASPVEARFLMEAA